MSEAIKAIERAFYAARFGDAHEGIDRLLGGTARRDRRLYETAVLLRARVLRYEGRCDELLVELEAFRPTFALNAAEASLLKAYACTYLGRHDESARWSSAARSVLDRCDHVRTRMDRWAALRYELWHAQSLDAWAASRLDDAESFLGMAEVADKSAALWHGRSMSALEQSRHHHLRSLIHARRGDHRSEVQQTCAALDAFRKVHKEDRDTFLAAVILVNLAVAVRELAPCIAGPGVVRRVKDWYAAIDWVPALAKKAYEVRLALAIRLALEGDSRESLLEMNRLVHEAPDAERRVDALVHKAMLSANLEVRPLAASPDLDLAHELAQGASWQSASDERNTLVQIAGLYADFDPARARQHLARYRELQGRHALSAVYHAASDGRAAAIEKYAEALAASVDDAPGSGRRRVQMLKEAFDTFEGRSMAWRAGLAALALARLTVDPAWLQRALEVVRDYPRSWIARNIAALRCEPPAEGVDALTATQRQAALLRAEGLSYTAIAERLGVGRDAVNKRLQEVRRRLGPRYWEWSSAPKLSSAIASDA